MDYNIGYNIWISIYGFPGIPGGDPWIPWGDRWDLGTDGTWASRTPDTSSEDTSSELFIDTRPGPARPGRPGRIAGERAPTSEK